MNTNPQAKRILAYGDSITWGRIANQFKRYDAQTRWTGVAQQELGSDYEIIEEGLRGRFLAGENPYFKNRDGLKQFGPILASHFPLDLVLIFLGTNDTNVKANKSATSIAAELDGYFTEIKVWSKEFQAATPEVLIVAPPLIEEIDSMFEGAHTKSEELSGLYEEAVSRLGAAFFDSSLHTKPGREDGVHIDDASHISLGKAIAPAIRSILD